MSALEAKREEVEEYEAKLERYGRGRWYWQYRRRLDELKAELDVLIKENEDGTVG